MNTITVRPSLQHGIVLTVSGRDRNQIKEYLYDLYREALMASVDEYANLAGEE